MTKQLKFTSLLLLATSLTFAQQSIVNTSKSNIKDKAALDTTKTLVETPQQVIVNTSKCNTRDRVAIDTMKEMVGTAEEARKEQVNPVNTDMPTRISTNISKTGIGPVTKPVKNTERAWAKQVNPPIPGVGVVVKKNPGGGASMVGTTNGKGQVIFTIKEKGDYSIMLTNAGGPGGGASSSSYAATGKSQGNGVQGVKVALGKNPPGTIRNFAITNDKGEAEFKDLEPGNYKIVVKQADRGSGSPKAQGF